METDASKDVAVFHLSDSVATLCSIALHTHRKWHRIDELPDGSGRYELRVWSADSEIVRTIMDAI